MSSSNKKKSFRPARPEGLSQTAGKKIAQPSGVVSYNEITISVVRECNMKRGTQTNMQFIKPKRNKFAPDVGRTVKVEGCITEIKSPKVIENYNGWAIVTISGRTVVGNLPFLDTRFIYRLVCRVVEHRKYGAQYEIVDYQDEPFVPIPFNYATLKMILMSDFGMQEFRALEFVCDLKQQLGARRITDPVDPALLVTLQSPEWVVRMCTEVPVFKYEYLSKLSRLWQPRALARLNFSMLCKIADQLRADPAVFCFAWRNPFPVPEVRWEKLAALEVISGTKLSEQLKACVSVYGRLNSRLNNSGRITFTDADVLGIGKEAISYAIQNRIFTPIQERFGEIREKRWYTRSDFELLRDLQSRLGEILHRRKDGPLKKSQPTGLSRLNEKQRAAYDGILGVNLLIVLGDAGTGKTEVGRYLSSRYRRKNVLPVACYGRVAASLKNKYGRGFTIHKVLTHIDKKTSLGEEFVGHTKVLIVDESSTLTLELFVRLLRALPKLIKIIMLGDEKQMPPVGRGHLFDAMIAKYRNSAVVHRLVDILRVDENNQILVHNFNKIVQGETDLDISESLEGEHPFVLLPRETVPKEAEGKPAGVALVQRSLQRVLDRYQHTEIQILTQKNAIREDINHAMFNLTRRNAENYSQHLFYVGEKIMFTENNYGNVDGPPQTRSTAVMNGEVRTVVSIYDVDPFAEDPDEARTHEVYSTADPKNNLSWHRMMQFDDGGRINLRHYEISNISKGSASTVAMAQGSEYPVCVFYIHDRISRTLTVRELYTALTRAKRRVIVIGQSGELERIIRTPYEAPESTVTNWLPDL